MRAPKFTLWPWGLLAAAVPVLAAGAAVYTHQQKHPEFIATIALGLLGAGNAYIIAIAGGNLRRLVFAIPIGVAAAALPRLALSTRPVFAVYLLVLVLWVIGMLAEHYLKRHRRLGLRDMASMILVASFVGTIAFFGGGGLMLNPEYLSEPQVQIPVCYPFINIAVAACMANKTKRSGGIEAGMTGISASLVGLLAGGVVLSLPLLVYALFPNLVTTERQFKLAGIASVTVAFAVCNFYCMYRLFGSIYRLEPSGTEQHEVVAAAEFAETFPPEAPQSEEIKEP